MPQRVALTVDEEFAGTLARVTRRGMFGSQGEAVGEAIERHKIIYGEAGQGFTQLLVRNAAGQEKQILVPSVERLLKRRPWRVRLRERAAILLNRLF